ncbi:dihydrolipoamide acetyltransferase family protein [Prescottella sp. R16]|uniref:dihydrolipoamide acetyltransferase family protein n=1 Tax=Prescottella sp. R16 TaxID=3064529 RepID=UPI00272EA33D|nr:dihydrolipoamide acetyltransferase family protein [Prescottella sp. R16]
MSTTENTVADFRLPDLGEGLTEAELVSWSVAVGDTVTLNQPIGEVETAKALVELPSPYAGTVRELLARPGDTVPVGAVLIRIETAGDGSAPAPDTVLVGYGPTAPAPSRRRRRPTAAPRTARDRTPVHGVRRRTAAAMVASATVPQVTEFLTVDVTETTTLLTRLRTAPAFADLHLTPLTLVAKALLLVLPEHPALNASWDEHTQEIVTHHTVNLGIATATDRGLLVPNIKNAGTLALPDLCRALTDLTDTTRTGHATTTDLTGGTVTVTNIGVYGIDTGTPLLNPGEAAILALGAITRRPWVVGDQIVARDVTTLAVTVDHRLVDGEQASRFLADLAAVLTDPVPALVAHA